MAYGGVGSSSSSSSSCWPGTSLAFSSSSLSPESNSSSTWSCWGERAYALGVIEVVHNLNFYLNLYSHFQLSSVAHLVFTQIVASEIELVTVPSAPRNQSGNIFTNLRSPSAICLTQPATPTSISRTHLTKLLRTNAFCILSLAISILRPCAPSLRPMLPPPVLLCLTEQTHQ